MVCARVLTKKHLTAFLRGRAEGAKILVFLYLFYVTLKGKNAPKARFFGVFLYEIFRGNAPKARIFLECFYPIIIIRVFRGKRAEGAKIFWGFYPYK